MGSAETFRRTGTLGIEEEYYVVDDAGRPTAGTDELVYEHAPPDVLEGRLDHELFKCVIEAQTPTLSGPDAAEDALRAMRSALRDHAGDHGFGIAAAGLHPTARWRELEHAEKSRYRDQLDRIQYPQHRNTTAGLHVHVGVDDADAAVWIANETRWYLPMLLALSANSPYWNGFDTGLASARATIFEALPNTGIPTAFESYEAFANFESTLLAADAIGDRGEIWWDVRPHSGLGTVEVRTPDAQAEPDRVLDLVAVIHTLVGNLRQRYDTLDDPWGPYRDGADRPDGDDRSVIGPVRHELLVENKWRALRYGREASFIRADGSGLIELEDLVAREARRLESPALERLADRESGAARQRRLRARSVDELLASLSLQAKGSWERV